MKRKIFVFALCFVLAVICCVPCLAANVIEQHSYNGHILPKVPVQYGDNGEELHPFIGELDGVYYVGYTDGDTKKANGSGKINVYGISYALIDGAWVLRVDAESISTKPVWSSVDVLSNDLSRVLLAASDVVIEYITDAVKYDDFKNAFEAFFAQLTVSQVVAVLAWIVGATVGLAFMWWGVRKLTRALMSAFKKGRVNL